MGVALLTAGFVGMVFTIQARLACSCHTRILPWAPSPSSTIAVRPAVMVLTSFLGEGKGAQ